MILCIAEKPSLGRDIAQVLGATTSREGYMEGNGYCVTWVYGHLCTLKEPADYSPYWKAWSLSQLPMIPPRFGIKLIKGETKERQFRIIERLIGQCDEIINCGDAGQEGELIQRWVMQKAGCKKPVKRLWINSLTDEAIRDGFAKLRPHEDLESLYMAGLCRAIGDWVLGMNATRLYTVKYGTNRQILSIGRVQTPTLALVVNRQLEIDNFVPKDYWELKTLYRNALFSSTGKNYDSEEKALADLESIKDLPFTITDVTKKKGKEAPPRLFDLTSLQVECNRKFGLGAEETLRLIQSLYEKKVTTYPRVDTTYLPDDVFPQCRNILNSLTHMSNLLEPLRGSALKKNKKVFDNSKITDHHAIIPTGQPLPPGLSPDERRVFDLIAKRFISAFYPDCEFEQTVVKGKAGKMEFKTSGRVILNEGWKFVYAKEEKSSDESADDAKQNKEDEELRVLPAFEIGESGPHTPQIVKKTTQPPKYYTEGSLLKAMETAGSTVEDEDLREALKANGIGRPSTRANIIETLYMRGYIRKERKSLRATQAGIDLISLIKEDLLKSAKLTGIWEGRLRAIERGDYSAAEFIDQIKQMITEIVKSVISDPTNRRIVAEQLSPAELAAQSKEKSAKEKSSKTKKSSAKKKKE